jgi:hypothetical protein
MLLSDFAHRSRSPRFSVASKGRHRQRNEDKGMVRVPIPLSNLTGFEPDRIEMALDRIYWQEHEGVSGQRTRALAEAMMGEEEPARVPEDGWRVKVAFGAQFRLLRLTGSASGEPKRFVIQLQPDPVLLAGSSGAPFVELLLQQLFGGQVKRVLFRMDVGVFGQGEFDDGLFGGFAEE